MASASLVLAGGAAADVLTRMLTSLSDATGLATPSDL
jgi:hypothetical protein